MNLENFAPVKAFVVYFDSDREVISEVTMHAETLWPISLTRAIKIFKPELASGAIVNFESITGELSETVVYRF